MPKEESHFWSNFVFGIIVLILLVGISVMIYYSVNHNSNTPTTGGADSSCKTNTDCPGLICGSDGKCVISIGGNCVANPNSCITGSSCIDGLCTNNQLRVVNFDQSQILLAQSIALSYTVDKLSEPKNLALKSIQKSNNKQKIYENNQYPGVVPMPNQYSFQPQNINTFK
jgi:hypothetical protein